MARQVQFGTVAGVSTSSTHCTCPPLAIFAAVPGALSNLKIAVQTLAKLQHCVPLVCHQADCSPLSHLTAWKYVKCCFRFFSCIRRCSDKGLLRRIYRSTLLATRSTILCVPSVGDNDVAGSVLVCWQCSPNLACLCVVCSVHFATESISST